MTIQSINDVVTNSSMEIYVMATDYTVKHMYEIIDVILKQAGSNYKGADLFDITIDYGPMFDAYFEYIHESELSIEEHNTVVRILEERAGVSECYDKLLATGLIESGKLMSIEDFTNNYGSDWRESYPQTKLSIKPKGECSKKDLHTLSMINNLFDYEASYN